MKSWGALIVGMVGLAVLDGVVSRQSAASNVGGWLEGAGSLVNKFLNPTVPLFGSVSATNQAAVTSTASGAGQSVTSTTSGSASSPVVSTAPVLTFPAGTTPGSVD
jgi:hypothetical protein